MMIHPTKKIPLLVIFVPLMIKPLEATEAAKVPKSWKITTEDFRVILVLEFNNLRTKIILTESWKFLLNFSTFSIGGCWGQSMLLFWKLVDKTQISKPQDHTDNFKHNPIGIFLSVRPKLLLTFQYEIPCMSNKLGYSMDNGNRLKLIIVTHGNWKKNQNSGGRFGATS